MTGDLLAPLEALFDSLGMASLALDDETRTLGWNREFTRLFPEHAGHIHRGEPYAENLRRFYAARLDAAEASNIDAYVADGVERHLRQVAPYEFLHRGRWLRVAVLRVPDVGSLRVWTAIGPSHDGNHLAEQMAHSGKRSAIGAMDHIADGLMVRDPTGHIVMANHRFAEIYGLASPEAAIGSRFPDLLDVAWAGGPGAERARLSWADNSRFAGAPFDLPLPGDRWVRLRDHRSHDGCVVSTHVDVTDLVRLQRRAAEAQRRAECLAARLQAEMEERKRAESRTIQVARLVSLGEMATGLAHELNQPLCALALAADTATISLQRHGDAAITETLQRLDQIAATAVRARSIIDHLRLFACPEDATVAPDEVDLGEAVRGALTLTEAAIRSAGIRLQVCLPPVPVPVIGRLVSLEQVILNLLMNARDAVQGNLAAGGVIRLRLDLREGAALLTVADNGGGFTEAALKHAFEPFFTTKPIGKGTGIGLSIAYSTVQAAGGRISLANADGGAVVTIRLPSTAAAGPGPPA